MLSFCSWVLAQKPEVDRDCVCVVNGSASLKGGKKRKEKQAQKCFRRIKGYNFHKPMLGTSLGSIRSPLSELSSGCERSLFKGSQRTNMVLILFHHVWRGLFENHSLRLWEGGAEVWFQWFNRPFCYLAVSVRGCWLELAIVKQPGIAQKFWLNLCWNPPTVILEKYWPWWAPVPNVKRKHS